MASWRRAVERRQAVLGESEVLHEIEVALAAGELDDLVGGLDGLEAAAAALALDQPGDVFVDDGVAQRHRDGVDERVAVEDAPDVVVVEDLVGAGEAERQRR